MEKTAVEIILDENNEENITLSFGDNDEESEFEQVAVIELDDEVFAVLHPLDAIDGIEEEEVLVFKINKENKAIELVEDPDIIDEVIDACLDDEEE